MKQVKLAQYVPKRPTTPTVRIFVCAAVTAFFLLPAAFAAIQNKRYLGTLYMLNIGVIFFASVSATAMFVAWLSLAMWCAMPDADARKPLY